MIRTGARPAAWVKPRRPVVLDWPACKGGGLGLSGAVSFAVKCCYVLAAFSRHSFQADKLDCIISGFSLPMSVVKKALSTDMLPQGLSDRQRFIHFAQLFEHFSNTGELDPARSAPR